jgi:flavin reductase (DIM6/NTAB) family NADH-FMN oxidoreductase RutF
MPGDVIDTLTFAPDAAHQRAFRDALGRFATGVTVVTTRFEGQDVGITANSFAALSLDPALVLWSPGRFSRRFQAFTECTHFAIHVLGAEQATLAPHFVANGTDFDLPGITRGIGDVPILPDCLSRFECRLQARHPGGDHDIVVGEVLRAATRQGAGLSFFSGRYGVAQS